MQRSCVACGKEFEAQRSTAKYCSASCRARVSTGDVVPVAELPKRDPVEVPSDLVESVRLRVVEAGLEGAPEGLLVIALAKRMEVESSGAAFASLATKLQQGLERVDALRPRQSGLDDLRLRRDRKRVRSA